MRSVPVRARPWRSNPSLLLGGDHGPKVTRLALGTVTRKGVPDSRWTSSVLVPSGRGMFSSVIGCLLWWWGVVLLKHRPHRCLHEGLLAQRAPVEPDRIARLARPLDERPRHVAVGAPDALDLGCGHGQLDRERTEHLHVRLDGRGDVLGCRLLAHETPRRRNSAMTSGSAPFSKASRCHTRCSVGTSLTFWT